MECCHQIGSSTTYTRDTIYFFTQRYYDKSFCVYGDCWISRYVSEGGGINAHHIRFKLDHTEDFYVTATILPILVMLFT